MIETLRLLLVEDDVIDQMTFQQMVQKENLPYDYQIASSTTHARDILQKHTFNVILTDSQLGDGSALDVIHLVENTPVIVLTEVGSEMIAVQAMQAGAVDYLIKDPEHRYLNLLPFVVTNAIRRHNAELDTREMLRERIRHEMMQDFIRDTSHNLRTPLTTLGTSLYLLKRYTELLLPMTDDPAQNKDGIQHLVKKIQERSAVMEDQRHHIEQIINDMLQMVKVDNLTNLEVKRHELNDLLQHMLPSFHQRVQSKSQLLIFLPSLKPLPFMGSFDEFASIVRNLLQNAIDYTPPGGTITVTTDKREDEIVFSVSDTGIGIPPAELPRIFDRFYRVDQARTQAGTGLGLALVKRLVELHNGRIEVASVQGVGTTFTLTFPSV